MDTFSSLWINRVQDIYMDTLHGIPGMKTLQATSIRPIPLFIDITNRTLFDVQITVSGHSVPIESFLKFIQGLLLTQMSRITLDCDILTRCQIVPRSKIIHLDPTTVDLALTKVT